MAIRIAPTTNHVANQVVFGVSVDKKDFLLESQGEIGTLVKQMIAARLADLFIDEHGKELLQQIDRQALVLAICKQNQLADQEKIEEAILSGRCLSCGELVRDYKAPVGSFAPEAWASLQEAGIDPHTGHRAACRHLKEEL